MMEKKITEAQLKRSVLSYIRTKDKKKIVRKAGVGRDFSAYRMDFSYLITANETVCYGYEEDLILAVIKACNNVAVSGVKPSMISVMATYPMGTKESCFKDAMRKLGDYADANGLEILGGDIKMSDAVNKPVYSVTAYGEKKDFEKSKKPEAGDTIMVTKRVGMEAAFVMRRSHAEELEKIYTKAYLDETEGFMEEFSIVKDAQIVSSMRGVNSESSTIGAEDGSSTEDAECTMLHDISGGGIFAALWEIGELSNLGMIIDLDLIPIHQVSVEISNTIDYNPYMKASSGALIFATKKPEIVTEALEKAGIPCVAIGTFTKEKHRIVRYGDEERYLVPPNGEELG